METERRKQLLLYFATQIRLLAGKFNFRDGSFASYLMERSRSSASAMPPKRTKN